MPWALMAALVAWSTMAGAQPRGRRPTPRAPTDDATKKEDEARQAEAQRRAELERKAAEERAQAELRRVRDAETLADAQLEAFRQARGYWENARRERRRVDEETAILNAPQAKGLIALPILYYSPETALGFGAFGLYYAHLGQSERTSQLRSSLSGTTKKQVLFDFGPTLWLSRDSIFAQAVFYFAYYPNTYVGIGNDTSPDQFENWTERQIAGDVDLRYRLVGSVYAGLKYRVDHHDVLDLDPKRELANGHVTGTSAGWASGVGPVLALDNRDKIYGPTRGQYFAVFSRAYLPAIGSAYRFVEVNGDFRQYVPIGDNVLAFQLFANLTDGDTPFYMLSRIGGGANLRGITYGRYRDNHLLEGQAEFRFPIYGRWGATAFLGAGEVAHRISDFKPAGLHAAGGTGLRYAIAPEERLNIRLDFAYSNGLAYYLDIAEAF